MDFELPVGYRLRPYRGRVDIDVMAPIGQAHRRRIGSDQSVTVADMARVYANPVGSDPERDIAIVETDAGVAVGYLRAIRELTVTDKIVRFLIRAFGPEHASIDLLAAVQTGMEAHTAPWEGTDDDVFQAMASHPGVGRVPDESPRYVDALVLERLGYTAEHFAAQLVRPHLDEIPQRTLPDGVELRPVTTDQLRTIFDAHWEAFRGDWSFAEATETDWVRFRDDPRNDVSLWKIAWVDDTVVGQVKSYIDVDENELQQRQRGYTEYISTHADWRNRGIATTLLAFSLQELRDRGFTEAALGVDTGNPGGAFQVYASLGFEMRTFTGVYEKSCASLSR